MAQPIARIGDPHSHGGQIVTGSPDTRVNGLAIARVGDWASCPHHGMQPIVTGAGLTTCNGRPIARVGDVLACGAVITAGSPNTFCN